MRKKVIIVRPYGYFGGTLVLDALCKLLREKKVDARLFYIPIVPCEDTDYHFFWMEWLKDIIRYHIYLLFHFYFRNSSSKRAICYRKRYEKTMKGLKCQLIPFIKRDNTIVVYPDVVYGNFLNAKNVVRWFMYYYEYSNDSKAYGKDDLFICFRDIFNDWKLNPQGLKVTISYFDKEKYKQYNFGNREGNCYIIRKGHNRLDLPVDFDGPIIDYGTDEDEIVRILNNSKYCYDYDTQTFYTIIAAVCGCIPIIVLEPGKTKADYLKDATYNTVGIAFGTSREEIEHAISTRDLLLKRLDYSDRNEQNINLFIQYTSDRFGKITKE